VSFVAPTAGGVRLTVHVRPGARRTEIGGLHGDALAIRIAAPPVDGRANDALIHLLAARLGVPAGHVAIVAGAGSRRKLINVAGIDLADAIARLGVEGG